MRFHITSLPSYLFYIIITPIALVWLLSLNLIRWISRLLHIEIDQSIDRYILITGCDSGFGAELVNRLTDRNRLTTNDQRGKITVFACCYTTDGVALYGGRKDVIALKLDITKDSDVDDVKTRVDNVLQEKHARMFVDYLAALPVHTS